MTTNGHVAEIKTQGPQPNAMLHYRPCFGKMLDDNLGSGGMHLLMFTHCVGLNTGVVTDAEIYNGYAGIAEAPVGVIRYTRLFQKRNTDVFVTVKTSLSDGNYYVHLGRGLLVEEFKQGTDPLVVLCEPVHCLYPIDTPLLISGVSHNLESPDLAGMRDSLLLKAAQAARKEYLPGTDYRMLVTFY